MGLTCDQLLSAADLDVYGTVRGAEVENTFLNFVIVSFWLLCLLEIHGGAISKNYILSKTSRANRWVELWRLLPFSENQPKTNIWKFHLWIPPNPVKILNKFTHGAECTPAVLAMLSDTVALAPCVSSSVFPEDRFARLQMVATKGKYAHLAHCFVWAHRKKKKNKKKFSWHPSFFSTIQLAKYASSIASNQRRSSVGALRFSRFSFAGPPAAAAAAAAAAAQPYWKHPLEFPEAATAETPLYTHAHTHTRAALCFCVLVTQKVTWSQVFVAKSVVRVLTSAQKHRLVLTLAACRMLTFVDVFCSGGRSTLRSSLIRPMWFAVTCGDKEMTEWWWWWWRGLLSVHVISWHFLRCIFALIRCSSGPSHAVSPLIFWYPT